MTIAAPPLIWYNKGLSQTYDAVRLLRSAAAGRIRVLASHTRPDAPVLGVADASFVEPAGAVSPSRYVQWALETCRERAVAAFVPSRHAAAVSSAADAFADLGVRLQVPQPRVLATLHSKDAMYLDLEAVDIPRPAYRVVRSLVEFDEAYARLRRDFDRLCVKPTSGIFGVGFRVLEEDADEYELLMHLHCDRISLRAYRQALAQTSRPFELMLMHYLDGPERSVDCLAQSGRLVAAVARRKEAHCQVLENEGPAIAWSRMLVERYQLDGILNIQFKDAGGVPHLLEINPRLSGGLLYSCESGLNFPYWSAALALGLATPGDIPAPRAGVSVFDVSGCFSASAHVQGPS